MSVDQITAFGFHRHPRRQFFFKAQRRTHFLTISANTAALILAAPAHATSSSIESTPLPPVQMAAYQFNNKLLVGKPISSSSMDRFNQPNLVDPGRYLVDIFINGNFHSRKAIEFITSQNNAVFACLDDPFLKSLGVQAPHISPHTDSSCAPVEQRVQGATAVFDLPKLRLDISVPQAFMSKSPVGSVSVAELDAGESMAFFNYDGNYYRSSAYGVSSDYSYLGLNSGINLGLWRLRQQGNYNYQTNAGSSAGHWNTIRSYAQRALPDINSELTLGDNYTNSNLFSSIGFRGLSLSTDERILPNSQLGYAPVVRGVALTHARITIRQASHIIYQTTVAPGPFVIDDLNATSFQGDLNVEVDEADGRVARFTVPFSAVPDSLREGSSRYSMSVGEVRQIVDVNAGFIDATYQRGLSNSLTANVGVRLASDYQSYLAGAVVGTKLGALGINGIFSQSRDIDNERIRGWRAASTYSYTYQPTSTSLSLASYRYSTKGYRDLLDALGARSANRNGQTWTSSTFQQRNQFSANINQNLGRFGQLYLSGSVSDYYDGKDKDTQFQLGYSNSYRSISYNLSVSRQQVGAFQNATVSNFPNTGQQVNQTTGSSNTNLFMFSVSFPLTLGGNTASMSSSVSNQTNSGSNVQTSIAGIADAAQALSYGINVAHQESQGQSSAGINVQKQLPSVTLGGSYSLGQHFWQTGINARGALVAHSGGLTLGPYLGDTFGLIEAKGAEGAEVRNGGGARIDSKGYALIPYLVPYRYNDISLDSKGINDNAEIEGSQYRSAPYAGASVKIKFSTRLGRAVLIATKLPDGSMLPLGSNVYNGEKVVVGMVGQGSKIYARAANAQGKLTVAWGNAEDQQCVISYDLSTLPVDDQPLFKLKAVCVPSVEGDLNKS